VKPVWRCVGKARGRMRHELANGTALALLLAGTGSSGPAEAPGAGGLRPIEVDCQRPIGVVRSMQGVNDGPITPDQAHDLSTYYAEMGVDSVRLHDLHGSVDIHWVFPDFDADPTDADNYDFASTDLHIAAIRSVGADIIYRLGYSWGENAVPPSDYTKWASICVHIVKHYNDGWANGFHYGITDWEIWNEPDIPEFWTGTPEEYFSLYEVTADAIKNHDPSLRVGGPVLAGDLRFLARFLDYCSAHDVPIDFVSWHLYGWGGPYGIYLRAQEVQHVMDAHGFSSLPSYLTEWNEWVDDWRDWDGLRADPELAAFTVSELIYLQDSPTDVANYYRGDTHVWGGMFNGDGSPGKAFYAFRAFRMLLDTPNRVYCRESDASGYAIIAGLSGDGQALTVLISDFQSTSAGYDLSVHTLPWGDQPFGYRRYALDASHDLEIVESDILSGGDFSTTEEMSSPSVHLIRLEAEAARDAAVTSVAVCPAEVSAGEPVSITVVAGNNGPVAETFDVTVDYGTAEIGTQRVTGLAPEAEATLTFTWDTTVVSPGDYRIEAVATLTGDANTANNVLSAEQEVTIRQAVWIAIPRLCVGIGAAMGMPAGVLSAVRFLRRRRS
jgi:xylan 1,4-beta-xylosidase